MISPQRANSVCHGSHLNSNLTHERGTMTLGPAQGHEISTRHRGTRVFFHFFPAKDTKFYCNRFRQQRCFVPGEWCKNVKGQEKQIIFRINDPEKKTTQISLKVENPTMGPHPPGKIARKIAIGIFSRRTMEPVMKLAAKGEWTKHG